jgi:hypothetical protein
MSNPPPPPPSTESIAAAPCDDRNLVRELAAEVVELRRRLDFFRQEQELLLRPIRGAPPPYQHTFSNSLASPSSMPPIPSVPPPLPAVSEGHFLSREAQYIDLILKERERYQTHIDQLERHRAQLLSNPRPFMATNFNEHHSFETGQRASFMHGWPGAISMYPPSMILPPPPLTVRSELQRDEFSRIGSGPPFSGISREEYEASLIWARGGPSATTYYEGGHEEAAEISRASLLRGRNPDADLRESQLLGHPSTYPSIGSRVPPAAAVVGNDQPATGCLPPLYPTTNRLQSLSRPSSHQQFASAGFTEHSDMPVETGLASAEHRTPLNNMTTVSPDGVVFKTRGGRSPNLVTRGASTDSESTVHMMRNDSGSVRGEEEPSTSANIDATMIPQESFDEQSRKQTLNLSSSSRNLSSPTTDEQPLGLPTTKRKLPIDFVPSPDTVVLGKGNGPKINPGNLKLKGLIVDHLDGYIKGERREKIAVISSLVRHVKRANRVAGFVKYEDESWWEVTERDARVKVTALFRDCLHDKYRSSSNSKVRRRQLLRGKGNEVGDNNSYSCADDEGVS